MDILTGLGLAAPAGLNAPLVLLLAGLAARFTGLIDLPPDYDLLDDWAVLGGLGVWLLVEETLDKIPALDHVNDAVNSALRPAAGAVLALATTQPDLPPVVAGALGAVVAGIAHATKAGTRPALTLGTGGVGNPVMSVIEDVVAVFAVLIALVVPVLVVVLLAALAWWTVTVVRRVRRRAARRAPPPPPAPHRR
jgi:hypothetical protein